MKESIEVRAYRPDDDEGIAELLQAHMRGDQTWPPAYARQGNVGDWVAGRSGVGRWVALQGGRVIAHVGADPVEPGSKADLWLAELGCPRERLAEIGRLVVHPQVRRTGVSEILTRRCIRDVVSRGHVPVATAFQTAEASLGMMTGLGWRVIGEFQGRRSGRTIVALIPPGQLREAALAVAW